MLSPAMTTAASAPVIQPVIIARLDIKNDPVTVWDGPGIFAPTSTGDQDLDGQIFTTAAGLVELSNIVIKDGISDPVTAAMFGVDINSPLLRQVVRDKQQWRLRGAWIWFGLLDLTNPARPVVNYPTRWKVGVIAKISTNRDPDSGVITVTIDEDTARARGPVYRYADQRDYFPTDTAADYMHKLANSPKGIHAGVPAGGYAVPGGEDQSAFLNNFPGRG